jgi:hypothetical protein
MFYLVVIALVCFYPFLKISEKYHNKENSIGLDAIIYIGIYGYPILFAIVMERLARLSNITDTSTLQFILIISWVVSQYSIVMLIDKKGEK